MTYDAWMTKCPNILAGITTADNIPVTKAYVPNATLRITKEAHDYIKDIDRVEFYPPATVLVLKNGKKYTSVTQDGDTFDKETGVEQCLLQYIFDGKTYHSEIRKLIKKEEERLKEKEQKLADEKTAKEKREKEIAKKRAKRAEKERKQREYDIEVQKEAYLRALKEFKDCKN